MELDKKTILTRDDLERFWTMEVPREVRNRNEELFKQILQNQKDAKRGRIWDKTLPNLPHEFNHNLEIVKRLKKRIEELKIEEEMRVKNGTTLSNLSVPDILEELQKILEGNK